MAKPEKTRTSTAVLWIAGVVALVVVVYCLRLLTRETVIVRVAPASFQTLSSTVATNGKVAAVGEFQAHAPAPGIIKDVYVEVGDHVAKGAPLLDLDSADATKQLTGAQSVLAGAESSLNDMQHGGSADDRNRFSTDIATAKADQQQAQTTLNTTKTLFDKGAVSAGELAAAQTKLDVANMALRNANARTQGRFSAGDLTAAQARVTDARAGVAAARSGLGRVGIRSPIAGTVYSVPFTANDFIQSTDDLVDVADLNHLAVIAYFDEPEIGKLANNQKVEITWDAKPGRIWHGHVDRAPTTVMTYGTRNVGECLITIDDAHGDLLPNTDVTVKVTESQRTNVLSIPREALHTEGLSSFVYRIVNNKLSRTPVQVGVVNTINVEILSGLANNETIVLGPAVIGRDLTDGLEVKAVR